jgi:hypothetical protein
LTQMTSEKPAKNSCHLICPARGRGGAAECMFGFIDLIVLELFNKIILKSGSGCPTTDTTHTAMNSYRYCRIVL